MTGVISTPTDLFADLVARGLVHDSTAREALSSRLGQGPLGVYVGFDPTADSLHVGHLLGQLTLRRFQLAGHQPVALAGGATGMVGDPGGRSEERNLLDADTLAHNLDSISGQLERILDFEPGPFQARLVNNATWTASMGVLEFLRDVGKHATVNAMLAKDSVRSRIEGEHGISYTEFSYMLLQANDFRHLYEHHGVELQMGGSDQWGNITAGIDLIRRRLGAVAHGLTWPLLLKSDGTKFGKTAAGAVWLDPERTSPYQFRQFWMQIDDDMIATLLPRCSLSPLEQVQTVLSDHQEAPHRRLAQRHLADELTELVHGREAGEAASAAAEVLFGGDPMHASEEVLKAVAREVETSTWVVDELSDAVSVLVGTKLATSRSEARRLLDQGSVRANGVVIRHDVQLDVVERLHERWILLRKGRTSHHLLKISGV
jgi:tyrosyl-tRNA synthetase